LTFKEDIYSIGKPTDYGYGVASIKDEDVQEWFKKLPGHDDTTHINYGNVIDDKGIVLVVVPCFLFKFADNNYNTEVIGCNNDKKDGFTMHKAFISNNGDIKSMAMIDKYPPGTDGGREIVNILNKDFDLEMSTRSYWILNAMKIIELSLPTAHKQSFDPSQVPTSHTS